MYLKTKITKKNYSWIKWSRISFCSAMLGIIVGMITLMFKTLVEKYEHVLYLKAENQKFLFILFPIIGLFIIYIMRQFVFHKKKNKGISEVLEAVNTPKSLPSYKIPSHIFNGFITVVFGGTTGIEVSTVVATATLGDLASKKDIIFKKYRNEFIGAAIASGVTILFCSPLAGLFFSYETIQKQRTKVFWITHIISVMFAVCFLKLMDEKPLIDLQDIIINWSNHTLPFFLLLSIVSGFYGVYLTRTVFFIKSTNLLDQKPIIQLFIGALTIGIILYFFPELYGDGYHTIHQMLDKSHNLYNLAIVSLLLLIIKPWTTGLTLKVGGDGGVFAPSIFSGACLGLSIGVACQSYFAIDASLISFIILGVAFTVSATLHAPFTAIFLTMALFNSYNLFIPLSILTFISFIISKRIFPYTVYTLSLSKK